MKCYTILKDGIPSSHCTSQDDLDLATILLEPGETVVEGHMPMQELPLPMPFVPVDELGMLIEIVAAIARKTNVKDTRLDMMIARRAPKPVEPIPTQPADSIDAEPTVPIEPVPVEGIDAPVEVIDMPATDGDVQPEGIDP